MWTRPFWVNRTLPIVDRSVPEAAEQVLSLVSEILPLLQTGKERRSPLPSGNWPFRSGPSSGASEGRSKSGRGNSTGLLSTWCRRSGNRRANTVAAIFRYDDRTNHSSPMRRFASLSVSSSHLLSISAYSTAHSFRNCSYASRDSHISIVTYTRSPPTSRKSRVPRYLGSRRNSRTHSPSDPYVCSNNFSLPDLTSNSHRVTNKVVPSPASWTLATLFEEPEILKQYPLSRRV